MAQNFIIILMKYILVALFLVALTVSQNTTLASSSISTTIVLPANQTVVIDSAHTATYPNYLQDGSQWITNQVNGSLPNGEILTFQSLFTSTCPNASALITIAADDNFTAFFNKDRIMIGYQATNVYRLTLKLRCGQNNLTIVAGSANSTAALIFSVVQTSAICPAYCSNVYSSYNASSCICQCTQQIPCASGSVWSGYPKCACACPSTVNTTCPTPRIFNSSTCGCQCPTCPTGQTQNSTSCQCYDGSLLAPNPDTLNCTIPVKTCTSPFAWSVSVCDCIYAKACSLVTCTGLFVLNGDTCTCFCPTYFTKANPCAPPTNKFKADTCTCVA